MRFAFTFLLLALPGSVWAASPNPADLVPAPEVQVKCRALVRQLGSDDFEEREDAQKQLAALGRLARPALLDGAAESDDPEVRSRCGQLLPKATELDFQAKLDTFLADADGKYDHDLPGWRAFRAAACDEWSVLGLTVSADRTRQKTAREVFVSLLATRGNRTLIRAVDESRFELGERVVARKLELYEARYGPGAVADRRTATFEDVVALIFAEGVAGSQYLPRRASSVSSLMTQVGYPSAARGNDDKSKVYTALVVAWLNTRTDAREMTDAMTVATRFDLPDQVAKLAAGVITTPGVTSAVRGRAVSNLVNYGSARHIPLLAKAANDANVVYTIVGGADRPNYEVQLRDIVLGISLSLSGQKFADYGFSDRYETTSGFETSSYSHTRYYFEDDAARTKALAKWAEWRKTGGK